MPYSDHILRLAAFLPVDNSAIPEDSQLPPETANMAWIEGGVRGRDGPVIASHLVQNEYTSGSGNWTTCCENCSVTCPTAMGIPEYSDIISYKGVRITIFILYLIGILAAIVGNSCVILIVYKKQSLRRNPTILFICNLALCDIVSCLLYRPLFLVELFLPFRKNIPEAYDHLVQCKVTGYFQALFAGVIFHTMMAISQERLLLIVRPLQAKSLCSTSRTRKILLLIWFTTACVVLPMPILFTEMLVASIDGTVISFCGYFSGGHGAVIYFSVIFTVYFAIPLLVMSIAYTKIFSALYQRSGALAVNQDAGGGKSMRTRRSLARMMISISILFALCQGPNFVYLIYVASGGTVPSNGFFTATIVKFLPIISSALNPFIYTLNSRTFRNGFKAVILRQKSFDDPSFGRSFTQSTSLRRKSSSRSWYSDRRQSSMDSKNDRDSKRASSQAASRKSSTLPIYRPVNVHRSSTLSTKIMDDEPGDMTPLREMAEPVGSPRDSGLGPEESSGTNNGESDTGTFPRSRTPSKKVRIQEDVVL